MKFLARQPILTRSRELYGYELLFRNGIQNSCEELNLEFASTSLLDTSLLIGFEKITAGRPMFINCPRDFLLRDYISLFPPRSVIVEILESVTPDQQIIDACLRLKERGFLIALDDFVDSPVWEPLVVLADMIKVDFRTTDRKEQGALVSRHSGKKIRMLAEKVETQEEYRSAMKMGYSLFQGYFFCRPEMMRHGELPASKLAYLDLLRAATAEGFDIEELASKIKHEASLTFRLLRYLNSAAFGLRAEVHSVTHALSLLGERELRKWIAVISVGVLADGKPDELMTVPLVRGRFCELLAPLAGLANHASDLFLMGLLSVMDAILDQPLETILAELPVRSEIKGALLSGKGVYSKLLEIVIAQERAEWARVGAITSELRISEARISEIYLEAVDWSTALGRTVQSPVAR